MAILVPATLTENDVDKIFQHPISLYNAEGDKITATFFNFIEKINTIVHNCYICLIGLPILPEEKRKEILESIHNPIPQYTALLAFVHSALETLSAMQSRQYFLENEKFESLQHILKNSQQTLGDVEQTYFTKEGYFYKLAQEAIDKFGGSFNE